MNDASGLRTVRVSMFPDRELEVDDKEYADLLAQGLLVTAAGEPTDEVVAVQATARAAAAFAAGPPPGNASRESWAAYATSVGAPAADTDEGGLSRNELRAAYGAAAEPTAMKES